MFTFIVVSVYLLHIVGGIHQVHTLVLVATFIVHQGAWACAAACTPGTSQFLLNLTRY